MKGHMESEPKSGFAGLILARVAAALWVLGGLTFATVPAIAQNDERESWTLSRLVRYALDNNKGLAAARLGTDVAAEDVAIAEGQNWPQVDAVSSFQHFPIRSRLLFERHGKRLSNPFQESILSYGIQATLPLYTGGRIQREISVADAAVAASRSRAELTRQELIFNVTSTFYTYLRVRAVIAAGEALVRSVKESRRIAAEQVRIGRAARLDVLRLDARLSAVESQLTAARNDLDRTAATLTALLALPTDVPFKVVGDLTPGETTWDQEAAQNTALSKRPDLLALRRGVDAQRERIGIASARAGPRLDGSVFYGAATGEDRTGNDAKFLLNFRLPLYAGGILSARKRRAAARLRELEAKLAAAERSAFAEVERAVIELSSTKARLEAGARAITQAEEALRVESQKFREGRGTSNDLLLAEEALLRAKTDFAVAVSDNRISITALRFATGELDAPTE